MIKLKKKAHRKSKREGISLIKLFRMFPDYENAERWIEDWR